MARKKPKRNYAAEYAKRQRKAKRSGFSSYYERRLVGALKKGYTAQESRGAHPREKLAQRVRKRSLAYKHGAGRIAKQKPLRRKSYMGEHLEPLGQWIYRLSSLTPRLVELTFNKVERKLSTLLRRYGSQAKRHVVWRMAILVDPAGGSPDAEPNDEGFRSTSWTEVLSAGGILTARRLMTRNTQLYQGPQGIPEVVLKPLALYVAVI